MNYGILEYNAMSLAFLYKPRIVALCAFSTPCALNLFLRCTIKCCVTSTATYLRRGENLACCPNKNQVHV